jgi:hypothetical protein
MFLLFFHSIGHPYIQLQVIQQRILQYRQCRIATIAWMIYKLLGKFKDFSGNAINADGGGGVEV